MAFSGMWGQRGCCPLDNHPSLQSDKNTMTIVLSGYNYSHQPVWYSGADASPQRLIPLEFHHDSGNMTYTWKFYREYNSHTSFLPKILLVTSEDVKSAFTLNGSIFPLVRVSVRNGFTTWSPFV